MARHIMNGRRELRRVPTTAAVCDVNTAASSTVSKQTWRVTTASSTAVDHPPAAPQPLGLAVVHLLRILKVAKVLLSDPRVLGR